MALNIKFDVILGRLREADVSIPVGGSIVFCIDKTYAEMVALKAASGFLKCSSYHITDRDIIIQATSTNRLALQGHFEDTVAGVWDEIDYDLDSDYISRRKDRNGNEVLNSAEFFATFAIDTIATFPFNDGRFHANRIHDSLAIFSGIDPGAKVKNNIVENLGVFTITDLTGEVRYNQISNSGGLSVIDCETFVQNVNADNSSSATITFTGSTGSVDKMEVLNSSVFSYVSDSTVSEIYLRDSASLSDTGSTATGTLSRIEIVNGGFGSVATNSGAISSVFNQSGSWIVSTNSGTISGAEVYEAGVYSDTGNTSSVSLISVEEQSSFTNSGNTSSILNAVFSGRCVITLTGNTTVKSDMIIRNRSFALDPSVAHSVLRVDQINSNHFREVDVSDIAQFTAGGLVVLTAGTEDAYTGQFFFTNLGATLATATQVNGFTSGTVIPSRAMFEMFPATGAAGFMNVVKTAGASAGNGDIVAEGDLLLQRRGPDVTEKGIYEGTPSGVIFQRDGNNYP